MPYLSINTSSAITIIDKECVAREAGRLISMIAGKSEEHLMVKIDDNVFMTFQGARKKCVFIDLHLYTAATAEDKQSFVEAFLPIVAGLFHIPLSDIFMTVTEHDEWGSYGVYHLDHPPGAS